MMEILLFIPLISLILLFQLKVKKEITYDEKSKYNGLLWTGKRQSFLAGYLQRSIRDKRPIGYIFYGLIILQIVFFILYFVYLTLK